MPKVFPHAPLVMPDEVPTPHSRPATLGDVSPAKKQEPRAQTAKPESTSNILQKKRSLVSRLLTPGIPYGERLPLPNETEVGTILIFVCGPACVAFMFDVYLGAKILLSGALASGGVIVIIRSVNACLKRNKQQPVKKHQPTYSSEIDAMLDTDGFAISFGLAAYFGLPFCGTGLLYGLGIGSLFLLPFFIYLALVGYVSYAEQRPIAAVITGNPK